MRRTTSVAIGEPPCPSERKVETSRGRADPPFLFELLYQIGDLQELPIVGRGRGRAGLAGDLSQALGLDLGQMEVVHQRVAGADLGANPSAPTGPDDGNVDLVHGDPSRLHANC